MIIAHDQYNGILWVNVVAYKFCNLNLCVSKHFSAYQQCNTSCFTMFALITLKISEFFWKTGFFFFMRGCTSLIMPSESNNKGTKNL